MRSLARIGILAIVATALAVPASAQVVQSVQFSLGGFVPRGPDTRDVNDVLLNNTDFLQFRIRDFNHPIVNGEWSVAFGNHIEVGAGAGFYSKTDATNYRDVVNSDGSEIVQDLGLRIVPITGLVRVLPFGKAGHFQPYIGGGISALVWRYVESGQFVDANNNIFRSRFPSSGTTPAPMLVYGVKMPMGGDIYALTFEGRYQSALGTLDASQGFSGTKIDLSGSSFLVGFQLRF